MAPDEPARDQPDAEPKRDQGEPRGGEGAGAGASGRRGGLTRHPAARAIGVVGLLVLLIAVLLWWLYARNFQNTDDAFIDTHFTRVAPRVAGQVVRVLAENYQAVKAGQLLLEIDPRDYQARLDQATATKAQGLAQIAQAQAQLVQIEAQIHASEAATSQARATAASNAALAVNAAADLVRYQNLKAINPSAVAQQQLDQSTAQAKSTADQRDAALQQVRSADAQLRATRAQAEAVKAQVQVSKAQVQNAEAQIETAQLDLSYTRVYAPADGSVAQRTVAIGDYVTAGTQVMAIVPFQLWVTANFKETQLAHMRPGQPVNVHVDACPGRTFHGRVNSIQRGAGQAFAILPPENATGNYVKVVQRVPVRILITDHAGDCPLGPGLSVEPKVRVR
jgi:membrane fusion protein, multidrug efflux system